MLAVICDDHVQDRTLLADFCKQYEKEYRLPLTLLSFENAGELLKSQEAKGADVMFMDIYMEGALGIDAARILRGKGYRGSLIFITTSQEHYAQGYDVEAIHYLLKPLTWPDFLEAMRRVMERIETTTKRIRVTTKKMELDVDVSGIQYIEVYGHKTILHTLRGELVVKQSLSALEERLGKDPFLRCYRYFIVNMDYVIRLTEDHFLMKDGKQIPLSRDGRSALINRYMSYVFKRMGD